MVTTFGRSLLSGGSLLSGFTSSHKKLTLISGGCYFRGVVTIGTLRYRSMHRPIPDRSTRKGTRILPATYKSASRITKEKTSKV